MPKGRQRRLRNFERKAKEFLSEADKFKGYRNAELDNRSVKIGKEKHRRLIVKKGVLDDLKETIEAEKYWMEKILTKEIVPINYELVPIKSVLIGTDWRGVQEYFHRPSLMTLIDFFELKEKKKKSEFFSREQWLLCKKLVNDKFNEKLTYEKILQLKNELLNSKVLTLFGGMHQTNIIILGMNRMGKIRIALVDV